MGSKNLYGEVQLVCPVLLCGRDLEVKPVKNKILVWGIRDSLNKSRKKIYLELMFDVSNSLYGELYEETLSIIEHEIAMRCKGL